MFTRRHGLAVGVQGVFRAAVRALEGDFLRLARHALDFGVNGLALVGQGLDRLALFVEALNGVVIVAGQTVGMAFGEFEGEDAARVSEFGLDGAVVGDLDKAASRR